MGRRPNSREASVPEADERWALVLAGGDGTRLRALTRAIEGVAIPKQYCRFFDDGSLLERTLARARDVVPVERTMVIVNEDHLPFARAQLATVPPENVVVQPRNLETGPGLALSLLALARRAPTATVAAFPSDHWIAHEAAFRRHVVRALGIVERRPDLVALLGIPPTRSDTGFGWIEPSAAIDDGEALGVRRFWEKPAQEVATRLHAAGSLWNSFVMTFRVDSLLARLRAFRAELPVLERALGHARTLAEAYAVLPAWNFSSDFLARIPEALAVVPAPDTGWDDLGTPEAVERTLARCDVKPAWWDRRPSALVA